MGKWTLYFALVASLQASSIYWNSPPSAPVSLGLDSVTALNNAGMAVGNVDGQAAEQSVSSPAVVLLGVSAAYSLAMGINQSGQIAGTLSTAGGYQYGFYWSGSSGVVLTGTLGGAYSSANSINAAGQIVGQTLDAAGNLAAFLWSEGSGISQIGDGASESATDITDTGQVAYLENPFPYWSSYSAVGNMSSLTMLTINGQNSIITAMNDNGSIVGYTANGHGFLSTTGGVIDFGTSFQPTDINDLGQVVGSYNGAPALWSSSAGFQFLSVGSFSGASVTSINDEGQIVGDANPVPEPSPSLLCLMGGLLLAIAARWRRRIRINAPCPVLSQWPATVPRTPAAASHPVPPARPR